MIHIPRRNKNIRT